ncbi:MAG: hypothetical protein WAL30_05015 [Candidatus Aquirickettsiella sp.]
MPFNQRDLNAYVNKLITALKSSDYKQFLIDARQFGDHIEKNQGEKVSLKNSAFRNSLSQDEETNQPDKELILRKLIPVLAVWYDIGLPRKGESSSDDELIERQRIKYKGQVDKNDRHPVGIGLYALTRHLTATGQPFNNDAHKSESNFNPEALIRSVFAQIANKEFKTEDLHPEIDKIGLAISSFQTPNKKKKLIKYAGVLLALIAALACGLSTGGAIILLFPSLTILALTLGGVIALFGFLANLGFLSENFPTFMLSLLKKGGITEYINNEGTRKQFSKTYKYLLTPLMIFASLTVGTGTTALTYLTILKLVSSLLPILALIWPPLPLIIVGVLSLAVGITLTVAILTSSLDALKKVAALNMGFKALCQHAYEHCKTWLKNLKHLKTHEKVGLVIMLLLVPIALAGLAYYRYTAGVDLSVFIGLAGSIVMGAIAYVAQIAFTCLSVNKLKNVLIKPFSATAADLGVNNQASKSVWKSVLSNSWYALSLFINAIGNAVLVYDGSSTSTAGAVFCGLNSFTGNMTEPDMNHGKRQLANDALADKIKKIADDSTTIIPENTANGAFRKNIGKDNVNLKPQESGAQHPSSCERSVSLVTNFSSNDNESKPSFFTEIKASHLPDQPSSDREKYSDKPLTLG